MLETIDRPGEGEVHVWLTDLDGEPDSARLNGVERARAETISRTLAANWWANSRAALRELLAAYLEITPQAVALSVRGRPEPIDGLHFSVSHSGGLAAFALAACPVGIDLEQPRMFRDPVALGKRLGVPGAVEERAILEAWTRREAQFKLGRREACLRTVDLDGAVGALASSEPLEPILRRWTQCSNTRTGREAPARNA